MKKFLSILLATMMVLAMVGTAFADEETATTYTITVNNDATGHIYEAYQIFKGDMVEKTVGETTVTVLSNIVWGDNISEAGKTKLGDAQAKADSLKTTADAAAFAEVIAEYLTGTPKTSTVVEGDYTIAGLDAGYYLIKDKDAELEGDYDAYTNYILNVSGNVEVEPKTDTVQVQKKVKDSDDTANTTTDWQDSADHDIGDDVPFQIIGTLPDYNYDKYETYTIQFNDTMSEGLTFNGDVKVYAQPVTGERVEITEHFTATSSTAEFGKDTEDTSDDYTTTNIVIKCDDLKKIMDGTGEDAKALIDGSTKIVAEYTAELNDKAKLGAPGNPNTVHMVYSNNPNGNGTGKTPDDTVIVFTYQTVANKIDSNKNPLAGAMFKLEKVDSTGAVIQTYEPVEAAGTTIFTFKGLDDGTYVLTETTTPDGFNTIEPIKFVVTATHDVESDDPALTEMTGNAATGSVGEFTATHTSGTVETTVENNAGATLPSTGGIGTTLFYLFGGIMAAGSALILIVRRRADAEEE